MVMVCYTQTNSVWLAILASYLTRPRLAAAKNCIKSLDQKIMMSIRGKFLKNSEKVGIVLNNSAMRITQIRENSSAFVKDPQINPIYVSLGHKISWETCLQLLKECFEIRGWKKRVPQPIRQADILTREFLRKNGFGLK